ncbi:hypothetical protein PCASD_16021 [Puccinia coronata f. sp. avenae]|uniref:Uncharacterized protein n=1 Tax=Puccinia coronata f. sp. avenae TaxID=200324 RepID=A0A2N5TZS9_9BASI|nr:hypothetical protein PCASD_16021 [Puccinia coronata f. sp. avenae]
MSYPTLGESKHKVLLLDMCQSICLPPPSSNMQYNCHFLLTSNQAGVLELAEPIFDKFNHIPNNGVVAYDCGLGEKVLVTSQVLSFQADLPMHAEVTNTFVPNVSLNPCRQDKVKCHFEDTEKEKGIQDQINHTFVKRFQEDDTPHYLA